MALIDNLKNNCSVTSTLVVLISSLISNLDFETPILHYYCVTNKWSNFG